MFPLGLSLIGLLLGFSILRSGDTGFMPVFLAIGYGGVVAGLYRTVRQSRDVLNPVMLVLVLAFVRFVIPAIIVSGGGPRVELFRLMGLTSADWLLGHVLGLTGMLGVMTGWLAFPRRLDRGGRLRFALPRGVGLTAVLGMVLGLVSLIAFVRTNVVSVSSTVIEGSFRGTEIQEGSGPLFFLSLVLISSSVVAGTYLLATRPARRWIVFIPAVLAALGFFVLGGRVRAVISLLGAIFILWYRRREDREWGRSILSPMVKGLVVGLPLLILLAYVGTLYRESGLAAVERAFDLGGLQRYTEQSFLLDFGHLHALAAAVHIGPGPLGGQSFWALLWPISDIVGLATPSPGIYLVGETIGFPTGTTWAFHSTLPGDAYLNFGAGGTVLATLLFGLFIRFVYGRFRAGRLHVAIYALAAPYLLRVFLESIEKWGEGVVVVVAASVIMAAGRLATPGRRPTGALAPRPTSHEVPLGA